MNDCLEICTKSTGCIINNGNTHKIYKLNSQDRYN